MTVDQTILIGLLAAVFALFVWGRWRYDLVAFGSLLVVCLLGYVSVRDAFVGFGHPATITVALVLVISRGLSNSGVVDLMARYVFRPTKSTSLQIASMATPAAALSAFMNNVGALALLMPAAIRSAYKSKRSPAAILMPLSFASILGGMVTLIGTPPNLIIAAIRREHAGEAFGMFDFASVGGLIALAGTAFVSILGWRLIPKQRRRVVDASELFNIEDYVVEAVVQEQSSIIGRSFGEAVKESESRDADLLGVVRNEVRLDMRARSRRIQEGDVLLIEAKPDVLDELTHDWKLETVGTEGRKEAGGVMKVAEVVVPSRSRIEGRTAASLDLRQQHDVNLLAVSRSSRPYRGRLRSFRFATGDVLLLEGDANNLPDAIASLGLLPLAPRDLRVGQSRRAWLATLLFVPMVALASTGAIALPLALGVSALGMVLTRLVPVRELYDHVDWPVIVLLGSMIPLGQAMEMTGTTAMLGSSILAVSGDVPPAFVLGLILVLTMTLSDVINNVATAVLMAPVALTVATQLGVNADAFLMAVAIGASSAFLTPIGHQNNALILGPGGYRFGDYWRMGLPLEAIVVLVGVPVLVRVWPL